MKLLGIYSNETDIDGFNDSFSLLCRNDNDLSFKITIDSFILNVVYSQNEYVYTKEFDNHFCFVSSHEPIEKCDLSELENEEKLINFLKATNSLLIIYLKNSSKLLVCSDYFGLKTIYYSTYSDSLLFSTELKCILKYYDKDNFAVDRGGLIELLLFRFQWGDRTLFSDIKCLYSRTVLDYSIASKNIESFVYDNFPVECVDEITDQVLFDLDNYFGNNVLQCSDKNNVLWLSGGLDSRYIFSWLKKNNIKISKIVNFGSSSTLDYKYAKKFLSAVGNEKNLYNYVITPEMLVKNGVKHLWINEGYSGHLNSHLYYGFDNFDNNLNIYDGYAGDSILGGTIYTRIQKSLMESLSFEKVFLYRCLTDKFKQEILEYSDCQYESLFINHSSKQPESIKVKEQLFYDNYCRRYLRMGGPKVAEEYGKICLPFFNRSLFDECFKIPIAKRTNHKIYKEILNKYHSNILKIPSTSLNSKKDISWFSKIKLYALRFLERLLRVSLIRTSTYIDPNKWLRKNSEYRDFVKSILLDETTSERGLFNVSELRRMFKEHLSYKHNYGYIFVRLLDFEITLRLFVDKDEKLISQRND